MRLAWFTPWPPQPSGIAGRSAEIVPALASRGYGIDVYVHEGRVAPERDAAADPPAPGSLRVLGAHDFVWRQARHPYDLTVFQVGNSALHDYIWPYLVRWPGLAILHDARLHHARGRALLAAGRVEAYRAEFAWAHPGVSPDAAELGVLGLGGTYLYAWPMTRIVLATARLVAVHARGAIAELAAAEPAARIEHVTLGMGRRAPYSDEDRNAARAALGLGPETVAFGVFGALTDEKRVKPILRAFAATRARVPGIELLLAGTEDRTLGLQALARRLAVGDAVRTLGPLDDEAFDRTIAAVDVCLNLRWPSALEISGPWLQALAAARPTVIVDLPHLGHLPMVDPRHWRLHQPARPPHTDGDAIAVAVDILDEEHSLRLAMHRLGSDPRLRDRIGQNGRRYWESAHTVARMVDDVDRAVRQAAATPAPHPVLPSVLVPDPFALARELTRGHGAQVAATIAALSPPPPAEAALC